MEVWSESGTDPREGDCLRFEDNIPPVEFVPTDPSRRLPPNPDIGPLDDKVMIHTIHGGDNIPPRFLSDLRDFYDDPARMREKLTRYYAMEKDWGANQIAQRIAENLGLSGYWRVNVARVLMDFGRFPGITPPGADHLSRFAINYPFSYALTLDRRRDLLQSCYDEISRAYEKATFGKIIKFAVHTYDPFNPPQDRLDDPTIRPEMSILCRSLSFQVQKRMPFGLFDPLYPDQLGEYTSDRKLAYRISLAIERAGIAISQNYPYLLPDGSVEVRSQVWFFFRFFRQKFEETYPETMTDPIYKTVWDMLLDTNLRSSQSDSLRSYLHMFRHAPGGQEERFKKAQIAYEHIGSFLRDDRDHLIDKFRVSGMRLSTLGIEVRKDLIWKFKDKNARRPVYGPDGSRRANTDHIAHLIGNAMKTYLLHDRIPLREGAFNKRRLLSNRPKAGESPVFPTVEKQDQETSPLG